MTARKKADEAEAVVSRAVIVRRLGLYQAKRAELETQMGHLDGAIALCTDLIGLMDKKEIEVGEAP